jgi:hypothetical protein
MEFYVHGGGRGNGQGAAVTAFKIRDGGYRDLTPGSLPLGQQVGSWHELDGFCEAGTNGRVANATLDVFCS